MSIGMLRINKFEDGSEFKSICITIPEDDKSSNIVFSNWTTYEQQSKKKESEKSSRLVVKIVSGEEQKKIDLDSCAKEIDGISTYINSFNILVNTHSDTSAESTIDSKSNIQVVDNSHQQQDNCANSCKDKEESVVRSHNLEFSNSLDDSLQKVWQNNARIMENINMLNKTLNYTKKKEILDIICPKWMRTYPCTVCGKCFVYETGLRRHFSMRHTISEAPPRWQVVWTCIQCFQVWPQQDQASKHSIECCKSTTATEKRDCVREIKTSSLLQCEFCEKVYTSIPRLLRHSKIHTTIRNYECNSCEVGFDSYKMAEQHWPLCPWLNLYYSFSLSKMLLCNACDRKFRNYEQLYNHRYKMGHFMTKTYSTISCVKSRGTLVYQCELCTQWYNSIPQILNHRSQHHPNHDPNVNNTTVGTSVQESSGHSFPDNSN